MPQTRPNRVLGGPHDDFWRFCADRELRIQRCHHCRHLTWPAAPSCEACGSTSLGWELMSGRAALVSWCTFERKYYADLPVPWDAILVELDEGPLMVSNPHLFRLNDARAGLALTVTFIECADEAGDFYLPVFQKKK